MYWPERSNTFRSVYIQYFTGIKCQHPLSVHTNFSSFLAPLTTEPHATLFSHCERKGLLCMQAQHSNLFKDKYLPSSSAVLTNEKSAASCLCSPRSVKARLVHEEGPCPLTVGHRQGLYPFVGLGKHSEQWLEWKLNLVLRALPSHIATEKGCGINSKVKV